MFHPTFVSVELAANEVLRASTGRIPAMTPFADWVHDYDQIIDRSIRRAREFFKNGLLAIH